LLAKLTELTKPAQKASAKEADLSELLYSDPQKYAEVIEARAEARAAARFQESQQKQFKTQSVLSELQAEFPELSDSNHPLYKKAVEIYNALPEDERQSAASYKLAVKSAALEEGIKPRSKRPVDEEPSFGASNSGMRSSQRKSGKLDSTTEEWAKIFGIDTSNAQVKERLVQKQNRNWNKYEPVAPAAKKTAY
jgi:hypothetical protein